MHRLTQTQRLALIAAPLGAAAGLLIGHLHPFGAGLAQDFTQGAAIGVGIGVSLAAAFLAGRFGWCGPSDPTARR